MSLVERFLRNYPRKVNTFDQFTDLLSKDSAPFVNLQAFETYPKPFFVAYHAVFISPSDTRRDLVYKETYSKIPLSPLVWEQNAKKVEEENDFIIITARYRTILTLAQRADALKNSIPTLKHTISPGPGLGIFTETELLALYREAVELRQLKPWI